MTRNSAVRSLPGSPTSDGCRNSPDQASEDFDDIDPAVVARSYRVVITRLLAESFNLTATDTSLLLRDLQPLENKLATGVPVSLPLSVRQECAMRSSSVLLEARLMGYLDQAPSRATAPHKQATSSEWIEVLAALVDNGIRLPALAGIDVRMHIAEVVTSWGFGSDLAARHSHSLPSDVLLAVNTRMPRTLSPTQAV